MILIYTKHRLSDFTDLMIHLNFGEEYQQYGNFVITLGFRKTRKKKINVQLLFPSEGRLSTCVLNL